MFNTYIKYKASGDVNMEKPVAAVEFGSKKLKLVVGYELQGQVYVLYSLTRPYGHAIDNGHFIDSTIVAEAVKEISKFVDESAKIKMSISEACLSLPPFGLEIYQNKQITAVNSPESKVTKQDIRSVFTLIRNASATVTNELVDIIPETFILDEGRLFTRPPYDVVSSSICIDAKAHTLPPQLVHDYINALNAGTISVKRLFVAPYAASQSIGSDESMPEDYILVDIGSNSTSVSLIGGKNLFDSRTFAWGGDNITEKIITNFNINEAEAEKCKITYGINKQEMNFKAPVCITTDDDNNQIKHFSDELNAIIRSELDIFVEQYNNALNSLLELYDSSFKKIPLVLIGGGSRLNGLVDYILPKIENDTARCWSPKNFGARNGTFVNCLGMILANAKNPSVYDEQHPRVGKLTRDEVK